jgi:hypothetical protein
MDDPKQRTTRVVDEVMDITHLHSLAWVEAASSQSPKKDDNLFRSVSWAEGNKGDSSMNAWVRGASDESYAEGYRLAGRIVADYLIENRLKADFLVYPIVCLYRHNVELRFKELIPYSAFLTGQALGKEDRKLLQQHDLKKLWCLLEPILRKAYEDLTWFTVDGDAIEGIASYVRQLNEFDPSSESSRYLTKKTGDPSIDKDKYPYINIRVLAEGMEKLTAQLYELRYAFREAVELKRKKQAEVPVEDMDCFRHG